MYIFKGTRTKQKNGRTRKMIPIIMFEGPYQKFPNKICHFNSLCHLFPPQLITYCSMRANWLPPYRESAHLQVYPSRPRDAQKLPLFQTPTIQKIEKLNKKPPSSSLYSQLFPSVRWCSRTEILQPKGYDLILSSSDPWIPLACK